ncbi:uncharacterized protein B0H18DRAFT_328252 [Fomitopsis serialis]|uniref:uncharacterized protein n=1 Tax=Fomitopsis serialis TaxID=139415 RepID=UPI0020083837|nr:uncharacterized protein B0H18DRAFT_328252 [Neoantrodia serialis]KAH9936649.1 hypothetical protein B0H18DRAFT_328252 [Neoantrodia serialis]
MMRETNEPEKKERRLIKQECASALLTYIPNRRGWTCGRRRIRRSTQAAIRYDTKGESRPSKVGSRRAGIKGSGGRTAPGKSKRRITRERIPSIIVMTDDGHQDLTEDLVLVGRYDVLVGGRKVSKCRDHVLRFLHRLHLGRLLDDVHLRHDVNLLLRQPVLGRHHHRDRIGDGDRDWLGLLVLRLWSRRDPYWLWVLARDRRLGRRRT